MGKDIGDIENEKNKFYRNKTPIFLKDVYIEKVLVSKKISFGKKTVNTCYLYNDHKIKPFHIMLPETSAYAKSYNGQNKWIYFLIEDDDLLEKYTIWNKVSADKKNLIANLSIIKFFQNQNKISW